MPVSITSRERAHLKARAHPLEPIVQVGLAGLSDAVITQVDVALAAHELIKVRINGADREERAALPEVLRHRTESAIVQQVGRILVLWRPKPEAAAPEF